MKCFKYNNQYIQFEYNFTTGMFNINYNNNCNIEKIYSSVKDLSRNKVIKNIDFEQHLLIENIEIEDKFGKGIKLIVSNFNNIDFIFKQNFHIYNDGYILINLEVTSSCEFKTNYMAVAISEEENAVRIKGGNIKNLFVPFDNDKWVRFISYPIKYSQESYEFTAIYDEKYENGLVVGSLTHDKWKTGINVDGNDNKINFIKIYGGAASEQTRDVLAHGALSGKVVKSPLIFLGYFDNYKIGFETFGKLNSVMKPALPWKGGVPFGWNSWAALAHTLTFDKFIEASDFLKSNLQYSFNDNSNVYINFDAFWNNFSNEKLMEAIQHVRDNGQKPGIYTAPFITHENNFDRTVEGTEGKYKYRDLLLRDFQGNVLPSVDGLYSLDATHPGTRMKIQHELNKFIQLGVEYVKIDFLGHAAREGDFYNRKITTGIQAYNYGMEYFVHMLSYEKTGNNTFLSLSIAPIFPHGYGHGRRICCDAFGSIDQSEYLLNSLTYLWWMNDCLYRYNDPDHIVIYKAFDKVSTSENEALTRFNSAIICGTVMLNSDDYSYKEACERAVKLFTNDEVNELARDGKTFMPFSGNKGDKAADIFVKFEKEELYISLFNYSICDGKQFNIKLEELGLKPYVEYKAKNLWTKEELILCDALELTLPPSGSAIIKISYYFYEL